VSESIFLHYIEHI